MFKSLKDVLQKRVKSLQLEKGINEQIILGLLADYLKQKELFMCIPQSFKNEELTIVCAKAVLANELNDQKNDILDFFQQECPDITIKNIYIKIGNS